MNQDQTSNNGYNNRWWRTTVRMIDSAYPKWCERRGIKHDSLADMIQREAKAGQEKSKSENQACNKG